MPERIFKIRKRIRKEKESGWVIEEYDRVSLLWRMTKLNLLIEMKSDTGRQRVFIVVALRSHLFEVICKMRNVFCWKLLLRVLLCDVSWLGTVKQVSCFFNQNLWNICQNIKQKQTLLCGHWGWNKVFNIKKNPF